jgi:L-amino acid N-acyltransferase YncA
MKGGFDVWTNGHSWFAACKRTLGFMDRLSIRDVRLKDAAGIAEIYRPIVEFTTISFEESAPDSDEVAARVRSIASAYPWLVACLDDRVIGYTYAHRFRERSAYRHSVEVSVYVGEPARGCGVGRKLYETLLARLRDLGYHRAFAGIALPNDASIALHRSVGFEMIGIYSESGRKFERWIDVAWWQRVIARTRRPG